MGDARHLSGSSTHPPELPRRLWAWLALAAAAAAAVALVLLVLQNAVAFLIVLSAVAVASAAGWYALTRSGMRRRTAAVAAVVALAVALGAFVARGGLDELIVFVVSAVAFLFCSRRALAPRRPVRAAPPPRSRRSSGTLILNPRSGGGKVERFGLVAEARARGLETIVLEPGDDLLALAVAAAKRQPRALGVAGGDGSQALVAQVAIDHGVPFVCVPAGTRNHLALDLGLDVEEPASSLDAFVEGVARRIDVAYVDDRLFVNNCSLGVYAHVVEAPQYRDAKLKTALDAMPELLGPGAERTTLRFAGPGGTVEQSTELLLVSNNPYELRHALAAGTRPALDGGVLGIAELELENAASAAAVVTLELLGRRASFAGFRQWTAETFEVWSDGPISAGIDGEAVTLGDRLRFRIAPGALTIALPPDAAQRLQARRRPAAARVATLGRVALGRERGVVTARQSLDRME